MKAFPRLRRHIPPALAAATTVLVFAPSLRGGWLNWDDGVLVFNNPNIRMLGWAQLRWALTTSPAGAYQPLAFLTYALDWRIWGRDPFGYHLSNVLLHAMAASLCFFCARRILALAFPSAASRPGRALDAAALLAALIFALHPLRVESVSWIAERRDPLSGALWLGAWLCYLRARDPRGRPGSLAPVFVLFLAACLAKGTAVTLPLVLLTIDVWPLRRPLPSALREKLPLLALGAAVGGLAVVRQGGANARLSLAGYGLGSRLTQSAYAMAFYARKTVWPSGLSPFYELRLPLDPLGPRFVLSGLAVLICAWGLWRARRRYPAAAAAAVCYAFMILPLSGLLQSGAQLVADRYSYLAALPFALAAGGLLLACPPRRRVLAGAAGFLAAAVLAAACVVQQSYWRGSEALWRRALAADPASPTALLNLGDALAEAGRTAEAADLFSRALAAEPRCAPAEADPAAMANLPVCRQALNDLGAASAQLGDLPQALRLLRMATAVDPGNDSAKRNLARVESMLKDGGRAP